MVIYVIVGDNRHICKSRVVESLSQQGAVMGQTTVADIFTHADGDFFIVVFSTL